MRAWTCGCASESLYNGLKPFNYSVLMSFLLQVRLTVMPACSQLAIACMDSPLGVPGELSGPLLVKRCIEV
jgi:hypothetical protein